MHEAPSSPAYHGLIVWASVTAVKTLLKIKHADGFELNGVRALQMVRASGSR